MDRTALRLRARSKLLQEVDRQLQNYERFPQGQNIIAVREALKKWMASKEPAGAWVGDARNASGAVTELWDQVNAGQGPNEAEKAALEMMAAARGEFLVKLFSGTQLQSHAFVALGANAASDAQSLKSGIDAARHLEQAGQAQRLGGQAFSGELYTNAWDRIVDAFQGADFADILRMPDFKSEVSSAIGTSLDELGAGMVAGAGLAKSTVKAIWFGYKTGKRGLEAYTLSNSKVAFNSGDPMAAFIAVQDLIDREVAHNALVMASHAAEAGAKAGGMFLDLGAATSAIAGLAGTVARLLISISYMARDWKERYYANKLLSEPEKLDAQLFQECPLLGCYFLCCADTSMIVSLLFDDIVGKPSFKDVINHAVKSQLAPTLSIANHALYRHRFRLTGKNLPKITVLAPATNKTGDISYMKATGEIAMREAGWADRVEARIENLKNLRGNTDKFY